jgi:hypothetical protein
MLVKGDNNLLKRYRSHGESNYLYIIYLISDSPVVAPATPQSEGVTFPESSATLPSKTEAPSVQSNATVLVPTTIYQHIRDLRGIVKTLKEAEMYPICDIPPFDNLGPLADKYLISHGYDDGSLRHIDYAARHAKCDNNSHAFVDYLGYRGMPLLEAQFLWDLILLGTTQ